MEGSRMHLKVMTTMMMVIFSLFFFETFVPYEGGNTMRMTLFCPLWFVWL